MEDHLVVHLVVHQVVEGNFVNYFKCRKMKKIIVLIILATSISGLTFGQNELDALRYSFMIPGGTARSNAMGGAFGALGADASVLSTNPAGMGVYQGSDFSFSPSFVLTNSEATYLNSKRTDYDFNFNINNMAYIGTVYSSDDTEFTNITLGFAYNRLMNYNQNIVIDGNNDVNSITDWFAAKANGTDRVDLFGSDQFYSGLAWETYLIDPANGSSNQYVSAFDGNYGHTQREYINRNGYMGEYAFSIAGNLMHQLYIGATLGIQSVRFDETVLFEEIDSDDNIPGFKSLRFREYLETRGSGLNFKFGLLYRPVKWVRFGGAVHTPTFFTLNDVYYNSLSADYSLAPNTHDSIPQYSYSESSPQGRFSYDLNTPFRAMANVAFIIDKYALISIDYEYVDYSKARMRSDSYAFFSENENIRTHFSEGHNIRIGGEYRYGPISLRLGGAYYDSPYESSHINKDFHTFVYSAGVGIRGSSMYFDIALSHITNENYYYLYEGYGITSEPAKININQNRFVGTLGFVF